jgi:hypothetical protein
MPAIPLCRNCGADISCEASEAVDAAVAGWVAAGLLAPEQAARLCATAGSGPRGAAPRPGVARGRLGVSIGPGIMLLVIGAILVASAVAMVATQLWDTIGGAGRVAAIWLPTLALYGAGGALGRRGSGRIPSAALLFFGAAIVPFAVWVLASEAPMPLDLCCSALGVVDHGLARALAVAVTTFAVHAATLARFRHAVLTLPASGSWLAILPIAAEGCFPDARHGAYISVGLLAAGLALMGAGQAADRRGFPMHAVAPDVLGSMAAMMATTIIGADLGGAWEVLAGSAPLALIAAGCDPRRQRYLCAGTLFLILNIFRIGVERFGHSAGMPVALLVCGSLTIAVGLMVHRIRKEYANA